MKRLVIFTVSLLVLMMAMASDKLSTTTQMFLSELNGEPGAQKDAQAKKKAKALGLNLGGFNPDERVYATPDTIDGEVFIAAYVRLSEASAVSELEALGVRVQCKFKGGTLLTTLIPVDKIEQVAEISSVSRVNVSPMMKPFTYEARRKTNVDDVLTQSADAIAAGLDTKYDGTGVVLGVIDTGIDFNHIAFKDKNGNSRIKRAYVYNGSTENEYTSISNNLTDDNSEDHGTHTCSTAGGSSVIVSGNNVTVTDDHSAATFGGMAPGADLYLAGVKNLSSTYLSNAVSNMVSYADAQGKPLVVSNSWGSQIGPHDGTGDVADVYNELFGDSYPNRVALFASSNDGGNSKDNEGGGYHVSGTATSSAPLSSILRSATYINTDGGYYYAGIIANAWARSTSVSKLGIKIIVLNASTGEELKAVTMTSAGSVSGLSTYYSGSLYVYYDQVESDKTQVLLYSSNGITSRSTNTTTKNGETYYTSKYTLAIQVYPISGSSVVDVWGGNYGYFTSHLTTSGYNWKAGSDDMSVSDEATIANVIPVGAYVSKNVITDYAGTEHSFTDEYTMGDIAYFSSYATAAESPTGLQYPWITAPGARLIAGVNHNHTTSVDSYSYYGSNYNSDLVVNSSSSPYAAMQGTSMATPTAAGIVALWLQAASENDISLTVNDVKNVMRETAIHDAYTDTGANASHFGNGKIDALAGIEYICPSKGPRIAASNKNITFEGYATKTYTQTVTVTGSRLEGGITATLADNSGAYSISPVTIAKADAENGATLTITWAPAAAGTQSATVTLSSTGADDVVITLTGTAQAATPTLIVDPSSLEFSSGLDETVQKTFAVTGRFVGDVNVALADANNVYSISRTTISESELADDAQVEVTVSFRANAEGTFNGVVTISAAGAQSQTVTLTAEASDGGSASDAYLNIAKYSTIDEAGWSTNYVNKLYDYTEDETNNVGWLTMPVYGAFSSVYYSPKAQKWIKTSITSTSTSYIASATWSASDVYKGSSNYFTSTTARAITGSTTASSTKTVTFYVKNCSAVKLLGVNGRVKSTFGSSTYPTTLTVYECTEKSDGTLTEGSTAVQTVNGGQTSSDNNQSFNLSITGLDANKIYKVVSSNYRGYVYEIAFCTPLPVLPVARLEEIVDNDLIVAGEKYEVTADDLRAVYLSADAKTLYCKDDNAYINPDVKLDDEIDYLKELTDLLDFDTYDQSNWVALQLPAAGSAEFSSSLLGYKLKKVKGIIIDKTNPTISVSPDKMPEADTNEPRLDYLQNPNVFITCNFLGNKQVDEKEHDYFFVTPKPMEVGQITWAMWDSEENKFLVPPPTGTVNASNLEGGFCADFTNYDGDVTLEQGGVYRFVGLVKKETAVASVMKKTRRNATRTATEFMVYPLEGLTKVGSINNGVITSVEELAADKSVESVRYYNVSGIESEHSFDGLNIVVTTFTDGTRKVEKKIF